MVRIVSDSKVACSKITWSWETALKSVSSQIFHNEKTRSHYTSFFLIQEYQAKAYKGIDSAHVLFYYPKILVQRV